MNRSSRGRVAAPWVVAALLLGACASDDPGPDPIATPAPTEASTPSPEPTMTDTPEPPEPDTTTVPDEIDRSYVEAVLAVHDEAMVEGVRAGIEAGGPAEEFLEFTSVWWTETWTGRVQHVWVGMFERDADLFRDDLEPRYHEVGELRVAREGCIVADTRVDNAAWTDDPSSATVLDQVTVLVPGPQGESGNGTPWVVAFDAEVTDGDVTEDLCEEDAP